RQALWQLPGLPDDFPAHVARVFGSQKLRHDHGVSAVAYSPDGPRLAAAGPDGVVKIWNPVPRRRLRRHEGHAAARRAPAETHEIIPCAVAFGADGKTVLSACGDKAVHVWDAATGKDVRTLDGHAGLVTGLSVSGDGKTVATGGADSTVRLWEVETGRAVR